MSVQLEARFENRDAADLAVARLRRSGVSFTVADIRPARGRHFDDEAAPAAGVNVFFPFAPGGFVNSAATGTTFEPFGTRAILAYTGETEQGTGRETLLSITVSEVSAERAESILRNAHGYSLRLRH